MWAAAFWPEFKLPAPADRIQHDAVRAAATFLSEHTGLLPNDDAPSNATQLAVLAVELHDAFLRHDGAGHTAVVDPDPQLVRVELTRRTRAVDALPR